MKEYNPVEAAINEIGNLLDKIKDPQNKIKDPLPPEVLKQLEKLEQEVKFVNQLNTQFFQEAGVDIQLVTQEIINAPETPLKEKRMLERSQSIQYEAKSLSQQLMVIINKMKKQEPKDQQKQIIKEHKKKFKPLGGNRGWIPM